MADKISGSEFKEKVLESSIPVVVDFYADWCGPCKMMAPIVDRVAQTLAGKCAFYKLDIDKEGEIAAQYGVMTIPTLILFKDGAETERSVGVISEGELMQKLAEL